jgi:hypothetical protein
MCEHRANVYKLDASQDNYMSKCPVGHSQHFGGYYLQYVNGNAPEIELPPPPPTT